MELIKEAALNTLLGMGMTFLVLISLSLIITLFGKILNGGFNKPKPEPKKSTPAPAPAPEPEPVEAVVEPAAAQDPQIQEACCLMRCPEQYFDRYLIMKDTSCNL